MEVYWIYLLRADWDLQWILISRYLCEIEVWYWWNLMIRISHQLDHTSMHVHWCTISHVYLCRCPFLEYLKLTIVNGGISRPVYLYINIQTHSSRERNPNFIADTCNTQKAPFTDKNITKFTALYFLHRIAGMAWSCLLKNMKEWATKIQQQNKNSYMELRNIACKGIERQEKKILIIGAAYTLPVQEISIRFWTGPIWTRNDTYCMQGYFRPS